MKKLLLRYTRQVLLSLALVLSFTSARATHIFGIDLYYTYVSGNTYTINMAIYGDCSAAANVLNSLYTATPEVQIFNGGTTPVQTVNLQPTGTQGAEVTPVCASQAGNTTCSNINSSIPGVRKFTYAYTVTLPSTSANWRFHFDGNMGGASQAGRSATITNVNGAGATIIALDAKLNNVNGNNSSSVYTTIPTPFFCINKPANFNPGAVDPNGDSLSFALVPGINQTTGVSVNYISPYTATSPLAVATSTFSFSSANGQLSFTPNALQRSLVVYTVSEYRNGVLVGTSQREMTVVVLSCNNPPPIGNISNLNATGSGVALIDSTHLNACGSAGTFTFNINPRDSNTTANITVTSAGLPTGASFTVTNNSTPTPTGLFSWNTTGVATGSYIFYLTFQDDACPLSSKQTVAYTVNILPIPSVVFSLVSAATCIKKAVFHVSPGGAGSPYTIEVLQNGSIIQTNSNITGPLTDSLSAGTYTIRVLNSTSCNADTTITIAPPVVIVPSVTATSPTCPGGTNGSLTITASGGLSPYVYANGTGTYATNGTFSNLAAGSYTLHVKDANLCIKDTLVTVPDAPHTYFNVSVANPWCNFYSNGVIDVSGYNSVAPYTYAINAGAYNSSGSFTTLNTGTYTVHVKNANGCIDDTTVTLTDSLSVSAALIVNNVLCYGGSSGTISVTPNGGFGAPYNYAVNSGTYGTGNSFLNLSVGTYTIHVRDVEQCYFDTSVTLIQPSPIVVTPTVTNISCYGNTDGSITANTVGGTPNYTYMLNGAPQAGNSYTGLATGQYIIKVTDQHNCVLLDTINITQPNPLAISSVSVHNVSCYNGTDGSFTVSPTGGTTPYNYAVNGGSFSTSNVLGGLATGTYTIHIKDANGCTKDTVMTLTQPAIIVPSVAIKNSTCHTLANGTITVHATGGTPSYMYSVGSGTYSPSNIFSSLPGGTYTVNVKDANGCVQSVSAVIIDSIIVSGIFTITEPLCYGQNNGSISVTGSGGASPYSYALMTNPFGSSNLFSNIAAGTYIMHVKDANGCIDDTAIAVAQPAPVAVTPVITQPSCYGFHNGHVIVNATGGTPVFSYAMNGGAYSTLDSFGNLSVGHDTFYVKDNNGCIQKAIAIIGQPTQLKIAGLSVTNVKCFGDTTGRVIVYAGGATAPYRYAADSGSFHASDTIVRLNAGTHLIEVRDSLGCQVDSNVAVTQPAKLNVKIDSLINPTCEGFMNGSVKLHGIGGVSPYLYNMNGATYSTTNAWYKLGEGTDTFYVVDNNSCMYDTAVTLKGYPHIVINSVTLQNVNCYGAKTGDIQLSVSGGVQPLSYRLGQYGNAVTISVFDSIKAGQYTVYITDSAHCQKDTTVTLTQPDSLHIVTTATPNECSGYDDHGIVTANVTGGTEPYSYLWSTDPATTSSSIMDMPNGIYRIWVTDGNNCTDSATTAITYDDCCKPYLPNAFTPNGDGRNDVFRIVFKGDMTLENFSVYNRYGQRVFNTIYIDKGWDGTYNGVAQDMDTYFYYVKAICGNKGDHEITLEGNVTLIR